ncbi:4-(cytidine 5'-diphospho)-2-C-methyl-D-erythritol kinase [Zafaria sp. Z1313]|uniref:4-(cytidine 5'-diphospho)-2-C-methyl-D-erythritol kinase n=1 Tax=unclassified Zafaria TaxID=2828765 RepID=UPI002E763CBB|nr:4-(cytidine 5'-diphospho)-2-C-methyl-D-erythritol kinase [Zafaria sp. J156]MEE1619966.1 4-(cytidine 5'-diphospho)-2-C-methyl-D-erythritol kinase [Zafaria sp. J156]
MTRTITARAPGKINVHFRVGPPREDGYHDVASLYLAISLFEDVVATARIDGEHSLSLGAGSTAVTDPEDFPLGPSNLALRAARALADATGHAGGVHLEVVKRVPIAGGMGGGSADAAAALVACNALWGTGLTREELGRIGAGLGADVPFALSGGAAVGLGIGDELSPLLLRSRTDWVILPASYGLSTPAVYARLDELRAGRDVETPREVDPGVVQALVAGDHALLQGLVFNDLTPAAMDLAPELAAVLEMGDAAGALASLVSGSGPTVALLAAGPRHAAEIANQLEDESGLAARAVHGPVHGASIV